MTERIILHERNSSRNFSGKCPAHRQRDSVASYDSNSYTPNYHLGDLPERLVSIDEIVRLIAEEHFENIPYDYAPLVAIAAHFDKVNKNHPESDYEPKTLLHWSLRSNLCRLTEPQTMKTFVSRIGEGYGEMFSPQQYEASSSYVAEYHELGFFDTLIEEILQTYYGIYGVRTHE